MKTAISIPDDLFDDAERLAQTLHRSRSRLYGDAMREYLARHSPDRVTEALDRLHDEAGAVDEFAARAARRTLEQAEW
jgi:predicted transcriptional regulator